MFKPSPYESLTLADRLRTSAGRRAVGIALALLLEGLLLLLLLTLGEKSDLAPEGETIISTFDARDADEAPEPEEQQREPEASERTQTQPQPPQPDQPAPPEAAPPRAAIIPVSPQRMEEFDISNVPREPAKPSPPRPAMGPPAPSSGNDTPIVGTAPNGQPLYAAQWYREPTHQQLAGYMSTAQGPGWGLIACKTAPEYRVEDCVILDEWPQGSNIARATLAASWQFKVLPPRRANRYLVGEWVRIRITLEMQPGKL